jgi:hypothetical protein
MGPDVAPGSGMEATKCRAAPNRSASTRRTCWIGFPATAARSSEALVVSRCEATTATVVGLIRPSASASKIAGNSSAARPTRMRWTATSSDIRSRSTQ